MLGTPEKYAKIFLIGKDEHEIWKEIYFLRRDIVDLKYEIEHPNYNEEENKTQYQLDRIACSYLYIEEAKHALSALGKTYMPTNREVRSAKFNDNLAYLRKLTFIIGSPFDGYENYIVDFTGDKLRFEVDPPMESLSENEPFTFEKELFIDGLRVLKMYEWRRKYAHCKDEALAPTDTRWQIDLEYTDGRKLDRFCGYNLYPYNFSDFKELFLLYDDDDENNCIDTDHDYEFHFDRETYENNFREYTG